MTILSWHVCFSHFNDTTPIFLSAVDVCTSRVFCFGYLFLHVVAAVVVRIVTMELWCCIDSYKSNLLLKIIFISISPVHQSQLFTTWDPARGVTFRYDLCPIALTSSMYTIPIVTVLFHILC